MAVEWLILPLALALSAHQAYDLANSLEGAGTRVGISMRAVPTGSAFESSTILTLMAATALLAWLASVITRYGVGSGLWVLVASATVQELWLIVSGNDPWPLLVLLSTASVALVVCNRAADAAGHAMLIDPWCPSLLAR